MELIDLRQTSATTQGPSYLKHVPEGLNVCQCGVWLRPSQSTMERIKIAFAAPQKSLQEGRKVDMIHGRQIMHEEEQRKTAANSLPHWTGARTTRSTELIHWCTVGLRNTSSTSTASPRLTSVMKHLTTSGIVMKIRSS